MNWIWEPLAKALVAQLLSRKDEIATAIAKAVVAELTPMLPNFSDLDDQLIAKLPDFNQLSKGIVDQLISRIPLLGGRAL